MTPGRKRRPTVQPGALIALVWLAALTSLSAGGDAPLRGVNIANALEAPREGDWGVVIEERYFDAIAGAGFTLVRLPVALAAHAEDAPPHAVAASFLARLEEVAGWAEARGLTAIVALHSYEEIHADPEGHGERFLALWEGVAKRFAGRFAGCWFEPLNEPHGALTAPAWNALLARAVERIRAVDPGRTLVLGGIEWSDPLALDALVLPAETENIVGTFHYYRPYEFTNQGAAWNEGMDRWLGREWTGSAGEMAALREDFDTAAAWSARTGVPLVLGEFGAIAKADQASRIRWTGAVRREAEARGFGWAYWDFAAAFALYDTETETFENGLLDALGLHGAASPAATAQRSGNTYGSE